MQHTLLHARLIQGADKLDNCRVKLEETMETLLDMDEATVGASPISEKVWASCLAGEIRAFCGPRIGDGLLGVIPGTVF